MAEFRTVLVQGRDVKPRVAVSKDGLPLVPALSAEDLERLQMVLIDGEVALHRWTQSPLAYWGKVVGIVLLGLAPIALASMHGSYSVRPHPQTLYGLLVIWVRGYYAVCCGRKLSDFEWVYAALACAVCC